MLSPTLARSWLFVPGDDGRKIMHGARSEADVAILDWEDGVLPANKAVARSVPWDADDFRRAGMRVLVRINCRLSEWYEDDLKAFTRSAFNGVVLPKCESSDDVQNTLRVVEAFGGRPEFDIYPMIESPLGLLRGEAIVRSSANVKGLLFGAYDFCITSGIKPSPGEPELLMPRSMLVTICRAHGVAAIDSPAVALEDTELVDQAVCRSFQSGFHGKLAIHPKHIPLIARVFSPTAEEVQRAEELLQQASVRQQGAFSWKGEMVDEAILKRARYTIELSAVHRKRLTQG